MSAIPNTLQPAPWQRDFSGAITRLDELLDILSLDAAAVGASGEAVQDFPLRVPRSFVRRMRPGDPQDPLLLQVLPTFAETRTVPGYGPDPLAEKAASPTSGLLHKYQGRVLVVVTGACAVHCRYCFRRHFPYDEHRAGARGDWDEVHSYVASDDSIEEVILSGGDPLSVSDARLGGLLRGLAEMEHVRRVRLHTRLPIVLPSRVDDSLLETLTLSGKATVVVVHANHGREIDDEVTSALGRLRSAGVSLLNQAVLLAGVNDRVEALRELSLRVFDAGVLPYYLHLLDPVDGAAHFNVDEARARQLLGELAAEMPGYLVPRLVREVPGESAKVLIPFVPLSGV